MRKCEIMFRAKYRQHYFARRAISNHKTHDDDWRERNFKSSVKTKGRHVMCALSLLYFIGRNGCIRENSFICTDQPARLVSHISLPRSLLFSSQPVPCVQAIYSILQPVCTLDRSFISLFSHYPMFTNSFNATFWRRVLGPVFWSMEIQYSWRFLSPFPHTSSPSFPPHITYSC